MDKNLKGRILFVVDWIILELHQRHKIVLRNNKTCHIIYQALD